MLPFPAAQPHAHRRNSRTYDRCLISPLTILLKKLSLPHAILLRCHRFPNIPCDDYVTASAVTAIALICGCNDNQYKTADVSRVNAR